MIYKKKIHELKITDKSRIFTYFCNPIIVSILQEIGLLSYFTKIILMNGSLRDLYNCILNGTHVFYL